MRKIVVDMQNFLFADSVATAFKKSDYEIDVVRTESPKDTVELCKLYRGFQYRKTGGKRHSGCEEKRSYRPVLLWIHDC